MKRINIQSWRPTLIVLGLVMIVSPLMIIKPIGLIFFLACFIKDKDETKDYDVHLTEKAEGSDETI